MSIEFEDWSGIKSQEDSLEDGPDHLACSIAKTLVCMNEEWNSGLITIGDDNTGFVKIELTPCGRIAEVDAGGHIISFV